MDIIIHRGTHQVGGCVTEISTGNNKILTDVGPDLPETPNPAALEDGIKIDIHRGTHQIGGCVTEISAGNDKVFIDFGSDLPGTANPAPLKAVPGLTVPD